MCYLGVRERVSHGKVLLSIIRNLITVEISLAFQMTQLLHVKWMELIVVWCLLLTGELKPVLRRPAGSF